MADPFITIASPTSGSALGTSFPVSGAVGPAGSSVTVKVFDSNNNVVAQGTKAATGNSYSVPLSNVPVGGPYHIQSCISGTGTCAPNVTNITVKG